MIDDQVEALTRQAIAERIFPGCVIGVIDDGAQHVRAFGHPTYDSDQPVTDTSIYDVASLTKTIVTATLMHQLLDAGRCALPDPVCAHIPEFAANGKDGVHIEHLMSYTLQLATRYVDNWNGDTSLWSYPDLLQLFYAAPLKAVPGETYLYTDTTAMLLGELIRRLTRNGTSAPDIDTLAEQRIFAPLGMSDSTLDPSSRDKHRIVPTGYRPNGKLIWSFPNDEKADVAYATGIQSGLAGLFTTVPDILKWVAMIFGDGRANGHTVLSPHAVDLMTHDYYPGKPFRSALGWGDGPTHQALEDVGGDRLVIKGGFTGCFLVGDLATRRALVFLSNRVHPARATNLRPWQDFRRNVVRCIFPTPP